MLRVKEFSKKVIRLLKNLIKKEEKHIKLHKQILKKFEEVEKQNNKKK